MGFARQKTYSMFTKRHYEATAQRFRNVYRRYHSFEMDWATAIVDEILYQFADMFQSDNCNFKRDEFIKAIKRGLDEN